MPNLDSLLIPTCSNNEPTQLMKVASRLITYMTQKGDAKRVVVLKTLNIFNHLTIFFSIPYGFKPIIDHVVFLIGTHIIQTISFMVKKNHYLS